MSNRFLRALCGLLLLFLALVAVLPVGVHASAVVVSAYQTILNQGSTLQRRQVLNMSGAGVVCSDDALNNRTNCAISGGGGGGGGNTITYGTYPTLPMSPAAGDTFFADNSPHRFAWDGSAWLPYYRSTGIALETWDPTGWVAVNANGLTLQAADVDQLLIQNGTLGVGSDAFRGYELAAALSPVYVYTVHIDGLVTGVSNFLGAAIAVKDSGSGRLLTFMLYNSGQYYVSQFTNETSASGNVTFGSWASMPNDIWFRIEKTGSGSDGASRRRFSISQNGVDFLVILDQQVTASWIAADEDTAAIGYYTVGSTAVSGQYRVDSVSIQ